MEFKGGNCMRTMQLKWDIICTNIEVPIENTEMKIKELYGGFGKNQRILTVPQIAALHSKNPDDKKEITTRIKRINELINNNIVLDSGDKYFEFGIDIIDLKADGNTEVFSILKNAGVYTQAQIGNSKNIFILSEQGYSLLTNLMQDTKSKLIYKNVIRDYFRLRLESLTHKDTEQYILRLLGKKERKKTTDTIKFFIEKGDLEHNPRDKRRNAYAVETNFIYKTLFGMTAREIEICLSLDLKKYDTVRNYLCIKDIDDIMNIEGRIGYMKEDGYSYQDIKQRVKELYPKTRKPNLAGKDINLIRQLMLS